MDGERTEVHRRRTGCRAALGQLGMMPWGSKEVQPSGSQCIGACTTL
jgi:hypothetical protein